jgi:hypothetical protein
MTLAMDPGNIDVITFLPDGKFFVIRAKDFSEEIMIHYFAMTTFEDFLDLSHDWGFSRILQDLDCTGIEVFRHPQFIKGEWEKCGNIKVGTSPTELRVAALPERARIEYTLSDDSAASASASSSTTKRRLSQLSVTCVRIFYLPEARMKTVMSRPSILANEATVRSTLKQETFQTVQMTIEVWPWLLLRRN